MLKNQNSISAKYAWTSGFLFALLLAAVKANSALLLRFDTGIISIVQNSMPTFVTDIMKAVTTIAEPKFAIVYAVIIAAVLWFMRLRVDAIWTLATLGGGDVVAYIFKEIAQRPRPRWNQVIPETGFSFPSGHTFGAVLIVFFLVWFFVSQINSQTVQKVCQIVLIIWVVLVMYSRVYLGAHYPSDVFAAFFLAVAWLAIARWLYNKFYDLVARYVETDAQGRHSRH
ncbi:Membrane-associated phospholipid phosphatase [Pediococcus damnosus]|uniref:Membrane-associated phospholipid phosphatase n=1 Tax=Pediococcus damnosus TaxID=51663 RepID=A0A0R2HLX1_9LACO|nr:phosphatase PAP2 family protein [Pediococcus damnosus]AMV61098.1 Membrane-associated phospholipid phosphatase [Pediococcus damnosus]AMV63656.1 Membrane-associated phospholipid phosphatase [Pediococcus damnosus]AMV65457.1 Membrane-associated phospholipid phosphatase [Pediococcus damnosus]AMV66403.1 Membrane-associated phospholipid phosphatase [Pediococcus damnosus]KJU74494.1 phospholipid phosphatase [Pediococcus damnosus LMG 28219]